MHDVIDTPHRIPVSSINPAMPDVLMTWDGETGWAHISTHDPNDPGLPRFVGFVRLSTSSPDHLCQVLADTGFELLEQHTLGDDGFEFRIRLTARAGAEPSGGQTSVVERRHSRVR